MRDLVLQFHSVLGILIFFSGLAQIILPKGGRRHVIIGQVYLYAWIPLLITGAYLGGPLISIVGLFGFYFALTGGRIGRLKNQAPKLGDKLIIGAGLLAALALLYYAGVLSFRGQYSFAIIFAVFGLLFLMTTVEDLYKYILNRPLRASQYGAQDWYFEHFKRMSISFIAAVTAFTSIQNIFRENTLNFLMPTVLGIIAIRMARRAYERKFKLR